MKDLPGDEFDQPKFDDFKTSENGNYRKCWGCRPIRLGRSDVLFMSDVLFIEARRIGFSPGVRLFAFGILGFGFCSFHLSSAVIGAGVISKLPFYKE
ncbi:hypothetical protein AABC73_13400 [Pseudomonas sp. G.S.17]|uniref:hypothetical protein n=1 Tax=Pseudomonas sp. G.S.17 TaxID=3137451 RepID=UPI00311C8BC8